MFVDDHRAIDASGLRIGIAVSRYHKDITEPLCAGAVDAFTRAGGTRDDVHIAPAPGAFELTAVCRAMADRGDLDGIVALGCILRGETSHDQHLAQAVANGLTEVTLSTGTPIAFGVLTCQTHHQARERAGGEKGNKGEEAMTAVIEVIRTIRDVSTPGAAAAKGRR